MNCFGVNNDFLLAVLLIFFSASELGV